MKTLTAPLNITKPRPRLNLAQRPLVRVETVLSRLRFGDWKWPFMAALLLAPLLLFAQPYSIAWYQIAGGGGTSTGGVFTVSGTIGQAEAGGPLTGPGYSLTGGFWSLYAVQTPGAPTLTISHSGNIVTVSWQNVSGWSLQQNSNLTVPAGWVANNSATLVGGTNYLNLANPAGSLFFRLQHP